MGQDPKLSVSEALMSSTPAAFQPLATHQLKRAGMLLIILLTVN